MSPGLSSREFILMQKFIEEQCGISIGEEKAYLIESRLSKLLVDSGLTSFEALYGKICDKNDPYIKEKVIDAITTNETLWFRDKSPWYILEDLLLPMYVQQFRDRKRSKVRIWSAACSTGQEPYSIAMSIDNYLARNAVTDVKLSNFEILATDISHSVLQAAKLGKFDSISIMRGLDSIYKDKYFRNEGRVWSLDEKIKNAIHFQQFNLQNNFLLLGKFDIIFCRYVIIYFSNKLKSEVMNKIASALEPGGILILGGSDIYSDYNESFCLEQHKSGVYYKLKE